MTDAITGASLLTETLRIAGVDTIFSLSGNQIMPVYDACLDSGQRIIHTRHENAAVYMASGYAQMTGKVGVALVTAGPGFANALSALYSARLDDVPLLLLSGDSPVSGDGRGAFQELDQLAMSAPVTKFAARPNSAAELAEALKQALWAAQSGRHGPVHLALPADVLTAAAQIALPSAEALAPPQPAPINPAPIIAALNAAVRPIILAGPQFNRTRCPELHEIEAQGVPVLTLESPRGLRDPALGGYASALAEADLIITLGKPLDFTTGFGSAFADDARIIAIDSEPDRLDQAATAAAPRPFERVEADPRGAALALHNASLGADHASWFAQIDTARKFRIPYDETGTGVPAPALCDALQQIIDDAADPVLCLDGGEIGQWCQALLSGPKRMINGLSGSIGSGPCLAMAAKLASPDATVIACIGDGTLGFHMSEFETAARENLPFICIVGNDSRWNAEHQLQLRSFGADRTHSCDLLNAARYDLVASGLGCFSARVEHESELAPALAAALASGRPALIDVIIDSVAAPTIPAG